jgi:hypothetical protein
MIPRLRVFISYAREDARRADSLYDSLNAAGFEPWMDHRDIPEAAEWQSEINRAIGRCHAFLACISSASTQKSGVLAAELESALQRWKRKWWWWKRLFLLPVRFEDCKTPEKLSQLQWVDVFEDKDWVKVARALRRAQRSFVAGSAAAIALVVVLAVSWFIASKSNLIAEFRRPGGDARVGITVWKLKYVSPVPGSKTLIHESVCRGVDADWEPLRTSVSDQFQVGDHVRVSIETGLEGYVYVVDRELHGGEASGAPKLVFPTSRIQGGNNLVHPGKLIELPDQQDCPPYWTLSSQHASYSGELLTVLIVKRPLKDVSIQRDAQDLPQSKFDAWQKRWTAPLTTMDDRARARYPATASELAAGQGAKTLTHDDPLPQTVFQKIDSSDDDSILVDYPILVK